MCCKLYSPRQLEQNIALISMNSYGARRILNGSLSKEKKNRKKKKKRRIKLQYQVMGQIATAAFKSDCCRQCFSVINLYGHNHAHNQDGIAA